MTVVVTKHRRMLSVPDAYKKCVPKGEQQGKDLKNVLAYFSKLIETVEMEVVNSDEMVNFLITSNEDNYIDNYYDEEKTRMIRTAVVKCNFTDVQSLMKSVEMNCIKHKTHSVHVSPHITTVHGVLDEIRQANKHTVVIIEQLECMNVDVFNRLISLLIFEETLNVSLLICLSTSRSVFSSYCSSINFDSLSLRYFPLPSPEEQFNKLVIGLARNEDEKAPALYLSGDLLLLLKQRFLEGDFSLSELKKIVRLSIVENYLREGQYEDSEDDFPNIVKDYWKWFDVLYALIQRAYTELELSDGIPDVIDLHSDLQRNQDNFWKKNESVSYTRNWMSLLKCDDLCSLLEDIGKYNDESSILDVVVHLQNEVKKPIETVKSSTTAGGGTPKMTMNELLKQNRAKQIAASSSSNHLKETVHRMLKLLKDKLFLWRNHEEFLLLVPYGIHIPDLSRDLASHPNERLSQAYTALAGIDQFGTVSLSQWGEMVSERMDNGPFFEAVAELERYGVIKDVSKQGKKAVQLQMRPMTLLS